MVAADGDPAAFEDRLQHACGKGTDVDQVAGDDDLVELLARHVRDDCLQRGQIAVDVGQQRQSRHAPNRPYPLAGARTYGATSSR